MKKKLFIVLLTLISAVALSLCFTACNGETESGDGTGNGSEQGGNKTEHTEHSYNTDIIPADCLNEGYTLHTCACGDGYRDNYTHALGHSFVNYVSDNNVSCINDGTKTAKCERCTETDTVADEDNTAFGHTEVIDKAVMATCSEKGLTDGMHCSVCNTVIRAQREVPVNPAVHTYSEHWAGDNASHWHAAICGHENVKDFADHSWEGRTCTVCDYTADYSIGLNINFVENEACVYGLGEATDAEIVIPSTYGGKPVTTIWIAAFRDCDKITSVKIPDSVKTIYEYAFSGSSIKEINIPDSVVSIKEQAFNRCFNLTKAAIGNGLKEISYAMFEMCINLKEVKIGSGVNSIGDRAFSMCLSLTKLKIPDNVITIGGYAFDSCNYLFNVEIGNGVTLIGESAFSSCINLMSIVIGSNVNRIEPGAFFWCYKLIEIYNLSDIELVKGVEDENGGVAFYALDIYDFKTEESKIEITEDGFAFYKRQDKYYLAGYSGREKDLSFPENYNGEDYEIMKNAFIGDGGISIDDTVIKFGIKSVFIPASVTAIGEMAFSNCMELTDVIYADNSKLHTIGSNAFANCLNLKGATVPENVTAMGEAAFAFCPNLANINYNAIHCYIHDTAGIFRDSGSQSGKIILTIGNKVKEMPDLLFDSISISKVVFEEGCEIKSLPAYAFSGCEKLESIELPDSITTIGDGAFSKCSKLEKLVLPKNLTVISRQMFYGCSNLTDIVINDHVTKICFGAFGYSGLENVYYSGTAEEWAAIETEEFGNEKLINATVFFFSETEPEEAGNFWHYVDGEAVKWA